MCKSVRKNDRQLNWNGLTSGEKENLKQIIKWTTILSQVNVSISQMVSPRDKLIIYGNDGFGRNAMKRRKCNEKLN